MPRIDLEDTIVAVATPLGEGGIAVIRVSGPEALEVVRPFFLVPDGSGPGVFKANTVRQGKFTDPATRKVVDQVLLTVFKAPHSYTGQDVVEISCHGGLAVTKRILNMLLGNGARSAEPGEFTKRAFLNGKLDLTQAEAVLDLIRAKSSRSLDIAARQLSGGLSGTLKALKDELVRLLAYLEASLDFPEEEIERDTEAGIQDRVRGIKEKVRSLIDGFDKNLLMREGILVTFAGKPNVGKSSLFNALLERDRALVSEIPHTTRDHLEEPLEIQGFYVRLRDTAGLGSTPQHPLDKLGMERTMEALRESRAVLYVVDGAGGLDDADRDVFHRIPPGKKTIVLMNKADLPMKIGTEALETLTGSRGWIRISAHTREGFKELERRIAVFLEGETIEEGEQLTRMRHKIAAAKAFEALERAENSFREKVSFEFVTVDLRAALDALKELTGEVCTEDLLDAIFSEFCIGK
ncbi:MAG: tRNA uridine-5-carboxymethylaminomethyl(34) synthesis GTPase MnmE [Candidatus Omnitrophica bacterium]|nr:tRNA uridine-5-carboxymethylaminomethyl(34) synthesis GTPase MnmE [Candidatus Omnitrophota bacterium]